MRRLAAALFLFSVVAYSGNISLKAATPAPPSIPSGERQLGQSFIEPAYNADSGKLIYLLTPLGAPFFSKANFHAVSPLYLVVYPHSAAGSVGTMNCAFEGGDNCPDHGGEIAGLANTVMPSVYGNGVWGHDHIVDPPGGADFNIAWSVEVILFTDNAYANAHLTTENAIDGAVTLGHAIRVPTPIVFNCNVVPAATYGRATPLGGPRPRP